MPPPFIFLVACSDYSTRTINGTTWPTLQPPKNEYPYLLGESVGAISGPSHFYRRNDSVVTQQGQAIAHAMVQSIAHSDARYCGLIGWCGFDYPSACGYTSELTKTPGVFDIFRIPKLGATMYIANVRPRGPVVIEPAFYFTLDNSVYSVKQLRNQALIWSNADSIQLFLDNRLFASLTPARVEPYLHLPCPPFVADFSNVPGQPELRIEAIRDGAVALRRVFASDLSRDRLDMAADETNLFADGSDATRVVIRTVDFFGNPRPRPPADGAGQVSISITQEGNVAELVGETPLMLASLGGQAAVWIRSAKFGATGTVTVRATHDRLGASAPVTIRFQ